MTENFLVPRYRRVVERQRISVSAFAVNRDDVERSCPRGHVKARCEGWADPIPTGPEMQKAQSVKARWHYRTVG